MAQGFLMYGRDNDVLYLYPDMTSWETFLSQITIWGPLHHAASPIVFS